MKKNILYIGNYLRHKNRNASYMFNLGALLFNEGYSMTYASPLNNKILRLIHMLYAVWVKRNQTDYVLIDTYSTQNFYYAVIVARFCTWLKLSYIPILHGGNLPQRLETSPRLTKTLFNNAAVNVSPSYYLKNAFESQGYTNVLYIPNSLNLQNYPFKYRTIETVKLLWVRSFSKIYNPLLAVKVLKSLQTNGYPAELCMVGPDADGSLKAVKQLAQQLKVAVTFTGKLDKPVWRDLAKQYNVFINTTNFDNTPVSVIEAMALGLPVVSTNVGGMPYLITHGKEGLLVNPNDVEAMTRAIIELYQNPDLVVTLTSNARQKVEQFDWEVVKDLWFEVLS